MSSQKKSVKDPILDLIDQLKAKKKGISKKKIGQALIDKYVPQKKELIEQFQLYQKLRQNLQRPLLQGAADFFDNNLDLPADLVDPQNPENDLGYLHLLSAVFDLKELKSHFRPRTEGDDDDDVDFSEEEEILENSKSPKIKKPKSATQKKQSKSGNAKTKSQKTKKAKTTKSISKKTSNKTSRPTKK